MKRIIINEEQFSKLLNLLIIENNIDIPVGSWVRTKTEEFQVVKNDDNNIIGKSFCDPNRVVPIEKNEIISIKSSKENKMVDLKNLVKLDFSKYYNYAGLNENYNEKNVILFLDDTRNPFTSKNNWVSQFSPINSENTSVVHVETLKTFINYIENSGLPKAIIFDNDLGKKDKEGGSGCMAAAWLVKYCINNNKKLPKWSIVSANKYGRCCIGSVLRKYEILSKNFVI